MRKKADDDSRFQIEKKKEIKINSKYFEKNFLADSL